MFQTSKSSLFILVLLYLLVTHARPIDQSSPTPNSILQPTHAYQAVALGAFGILATTHRSLMSEGFINSIGWGTDAFVTLGIFAVSLIWTGGTIASGLFEDGEPCRHDVLLCAGRLLYAPHILNATVLLWSIYSFSVKLQLPLWQSPPQFTRDAWSAAFKYRIPIVVNTLLGFLILFLSAGAAKGRDYTAAIMNIVGYVVYISRAGGKAPYNDPDVYYRNHNFIRAVLNTSHAAGTVYTTPNNGTGMAAVWSYVWPNQIAVVNVRLLPALRKLESGRFDLHNLRTALRESAHAVVLATTMDDTHLLAVSNWLLGSSLPISTASKNPQNLQLGREVFYYLHIVELFIFVNRQRLGKLDEELKHRLCRWRARGRSGAHDIGNENPWGSTGGKNGLIEVFAHVAALFGNKIPQMEFLTVMPEKSVFPSYDPSHPDGYAGQLWTYCLQGTGTESVFGALYIFCAIFFTDNGNSKGLDPFPVKAGNQDGDAIAHQIMWRQAWYGTVVAQFTASAVAAIGAFIGGLL